MVWPIIDHVSGARDPHLLKDISQLKRVQRRAAIFCCGDYTNRKPGYIDAMLRVLHWESLGKRRQNNGLNKVSFTQSTPVMLTSQTSTYNGVTPIIRGAQRFRHARADHLALYDSLFPATFRQWNRLPRSLSATTCLEAFRDGFRALICALISS